MPDKAFCMPNIACSAILVADHGLFKFLAEGEYSGGIPQFLI